MKYILLILFVSLSAQSKNYVHLGMWSKHNESGFNEKHNLIGIEIDNIFLYKFNNSFNDTAYYFGKIKRDGYCLDKLCLGYSYGLIQGYDFIDVSPIAFAVISYEKNGVGADITCLPKVVCAIQFRFSDEAFEWASIDAPWNSKGYFELSLDHYDPDYSNLRGFYKNNGASYDAKIYISDSSYIKANYTTTVFTVALQRGTYKTRQEYPPTKVYSQGSFEVWNEYEGYNLGISINQIYLQYNELDGDLITFTSQPKKHHVGAGVHISRTYHLSDNFDLYTEAAIVERSEVDLKLVVELKYRFNDSYSFTLRTVDWEILNYSQYQLGLRYKF